MSEPQHDIVIPDRQAFKATEVCELLKVQPYVLRTWENEFKELGVAKSAGGPRVYRRKDVELAVRIRRLVFGEGLTLAGARRRLESERPTGPDPELEIADVAEAPAEGVPARRRLDEEALARLRSVRDDLRTLLAELSSGPSVSAATPAMSVLSAAGSEKTVEPETTREIREFTLEPLDVEPPVADDDVVAVDVGKRSGKRRGRG